MADSDKTEDMLGVIPLDRKSEEIASRIIEEDSLDEVKNLTSLFNLLQAKKNVLRVIKLNSLLDKVSDQMIERFEKRPGEFSNTELLNYLQVTQSAIDRANKQLDEIDKTPAIQMVQNNQVNVNITDNLSRESKEKIASAISAILKRSSQIEDLEIIEDSERNDE